MEREPKNQLVPNAPQRSLTIISPNEFHFDLKAMEIRVVNGKILVRKEAYEQIERLKRNFEIDENWINDFSERLRAKKLSYEQLKQRVDFVIDNHKYPKITIADVLSDETETNRVKLYLGFQIDELVRKNLATQKDFKLVKIEKGVAYFVHVTEMRKHDIPELIAKEYINTPPVYRPDMKSSEVIAYNLREAINAINEGREPMVVENVRSYPSWN